MNSVSYRIAQKIKTEKEKKNNYIRMYVPGGFSYVNDSSNFYGPSPQGNGSSFSSPSNVSSNYATPCGYGNGSTGLS